MSGGHRVVVWGYPCPPSPRRRRRDDHDRAAVRRRHARRDRDTSHDECCPHHAACGYCDVPFPCPEHRNHAPKPTPPIKANRTRVHRRRP